MYTTTQGSSFHSPSPEIAHVSSQLPICYSSGEFHIPSGSRYAIKFLCLFVLLVLGHDARVLVPMLFRNAVSKRLILGMAALTLKGFTNTVSIPALARYVLHAN